MKKTVNTLTTLSLLLSAILISACSTKTSNFKLTDTVSGKKSIVYIYRPASASNILISPELLINDEKKFEIKSNSYTFINLPPDEHTFKLDLTNRYIGNKEITLKTQAQQYYFLRVNTSLKFEQNKPYTRSFDIEEVSREIAVTEIKIIPSTVDNIKQKELVTQENDKHMSTEAAESMPVQTPDDQFSISKTRNPFSK